MCRLSCLYIHFSLCLTNTFLESLLILRFVFFVLVQSDHVIQELVTAEIMKNIFSPLNSLNPQCTVRSCLS